MTVELSQAARSAGYRLIVHETVGSTSADAMERLRAGETGPLWIVARHQSRGRGRRGSSWEARPGNLFASLGLHIDAEPATLATLGFVAGLALVRALDRRTLSSAPGSGSERPRPRTGSFLGAHAEPRLATPTPFALKWPNDVLASGAKLAGILLETETGGSGGRAVVIGIGVNVAGAPQGLPYRAACLAELGSATSADDLFATLSEEWLAALAAWDLGRGFAAIRHAWLARAAGLGGPVSVVSAGAIVAGMFETIDEHGRLVIEMRDGARCAISAGDVHFGEAATARTEAVA